MLRRMLAGRLGWWLPPLVWMAAIFVVSSQPNPAPEVTSRVWDKLLHAIEYGTLGLLCCRALTREGLRWETAALGGICLAAAYGASDEYHQLFVPMRDASIRDWFADVVGAAVAAVAYSGRRPKASIRQERSAV
jgi:VanZ family protein